MYLRLFFAALFLGLQPALSNAAGETVFPFQDGRWNGDVETNPDNRNLDECWARTMFGDSTSFALAKHRDGRWLLRLSNPSWRLPPSRRFEMIAQVDFYPKLRIDADATSETQLEISNLEQISLLELIENGHTIDLMSDGFNDKYDLEGSAKVIARLRSCFIE
jgi:hypothetical protein